MKILAVSNLYPPHSMGGYELGCRDIVESLRRRGHAVTVLTSIYGVGQPRVEGHLHRRLSFHDTPAASLWGMLQREWQDHHCLRRLMVECSPDVIYVFSLFRVSHGLLLTAQRTGRPMVLAFSGEWLEPGYAGDPWLRLWGRKATTRAWHAPKHWLRRLLDPGLPVGLEPIDLRHAYFTSARLKERYLSKGFSVQEAEVIHWGVDTERFHPASRVERPTPPRLLFAGRIAREKGLHTAVEAIRLLKREHGAEHVLLDVVGPAQEPEYLEALRQQIERDGLRENVRFLGPQSWVAMPEIYRGHDVFVFPSIWEEPFSIGLLEAMASGLAVVGTTTGGSREILEDGVNSLTFRAEEAKDLARQLRRLFNPRSLDQLAGEARRTIENRFTVTDMMTRIEAFLWSAVGRFA